MMLSNEWSRAAWLSLTIPLIAACGADEAEGDDRGTNEMQDAGPESGEKSIKLLAVAPLTRDVINEHDATGPGLGMVAAIKLAFEEIDFKVGDVAIEIVEVDTKSDINAEGPGIEAYRDAVAEHAPVAAISNWHSNLALEFAEIAADNEMPHLFSLGISSGLLEKMRTDRERYAYFGSIGWASPAVYTQGILEMIEHVLEGDPSVATNGVWAPSSKHVSVFSSETTWGLSFAEGVEAILDDGQGYWMSSGWTRGDTMIVNDASEAPAGQMSSDTCIARAKDANASIIIGSHGDAETAQLVIGAAQELPNAFVVAEGLDWGDFLQTAGNARLGVLDSGSAPFRDTDAARSFREKIHAITGKEAASSSAGFAYDYARFTIKILERALEKHGELTRETVADIYIHEVQTGALKFDDGVVMKQYGFGEESWPEVHYSTDTYFFPVLQYQLEGQEIVKTTVYPKEFAGDAVLQVPGI